MRLDFAGVDPDNPAGQCPAVFVDAETGDFYMQGETVTDPNVLAWINSDSRILDSESGCTRVAQTLVPIVSRGGVGAVPTQINGQTCAASLHRNCRLGTSHHRGAHSFRTADLRGQMMNGGLMAAKYDEGHGAPGWMRRR